MHALQYSVLCGVAIMYNMVGFKIILWSWEPTLADPLLSVHFTHLIMHPLLYL